MPRTVKELSEEVKDLRNEMLNANRDLREVITGCASESELRAESNRMQAKLDELRARENDLLERCALFAVNRVQHDLDLRIDRRFRQSLLIAGVVVTALSLLGFFVALPSAVGTFIGNEALAEFSELKDSASQSIKKIEEARRAADGQPLIVLQTDFGMADPYMSALKGAIYSTNQHARIEVLTADIDPLDIVHASWMLWRTCASYPAGTIFVAITNPGGITAQTIVLRTKSGHVFIGHDNGVFDFVADRLGFEEAYRIAHSDLLPSDRLDAFGGDDLFGPVAAKISAGFRLDEAGTPLKSYEPRLPSADTLLRPERIGNKLIISAMHIDNFGNVVTNASRDDLQKLGFSVGHSTIFVTVGGEKQIHLPLKAAFGHVSPGSPVGVMHHEYLMLALNGSSFAAEYSISRQQLMDIQ